MLQRRRALILALGLLGACRDADSSGTSSSAPSFPPSSAGASGCFGPNQVFSAPQTPVQVPLATLVLGPYSQVTAAADAELLYVTGADATVFALDVTGPVPVETEVVGLGAVAFHLTTLHGIATTPELSGLAVLDATHLVLVEHASNTLLTCERATQDVLADYAGLPSEIPGFADGLGSSARFSFGAPTRIAATGEAESSVLVADVGNHALRLVLSSGGVAFVTTLAGTGTFGFANGSLAASAFDTPSGVTLGCNETVIVSERGDNGFGQRLRSVQISAASPFGGWFGSAATLAGTGTAGSSEGTASTALLSAPVSPLSTAGGELYWIDSGTGVLRRRQASGSCDCPLALDCATAVATPDFPAGHDFSLTQTSSGVLYVLDATDGVLWRVTP